MKANDFHVHVRSLACHLCCVPAAASTTHLTTQQQQQARTVNCSLTMHSRHNAITRHWPAEQLRGRGRHVSSCELTRWSHGRARARWCAPAGMMKKQLADLQWFEYMHTQRNLTAFFVCICSLWPPVVQLLPSHLIHTFVKVIYFTHTQEQTRTPVNESNFQSL